MLEELIAHHCAPALAGIKPANIASCRRDAVPDVYDEIKRLNRELNRSDIYFEIICDCEKCVLIMAYRKSILKKHLETAANQKFLLQYGYPISEDIGEYISILKQRLSKNSFPHEIGVFLGYPLHDIYGFINHRDEGCLLVGEWKVYHDREGAAELFRRFKICRAAVTKRITAGKTLAQVFCTA